MFFVVFAGLLLAVLVVCGLCTVSFFSVAFAGPQQAIGNPARGSRSLSLAKPAAKLPVASSCKGTCRRCAKSCFAGMRLIPVTPPEALAIADHLRRTQSAQQIDGILAIAVAQAAELAQHPGTANPPGCALLAGDGHCLAGPVRPVACSTSSEIAVGASESALPATASPATEGLYQGLRLAGLDMTTYELNGAVAVALSAADAAERWQRHEPVFAGCRSAN